ncbi:MAG: hypothetical protein CL605_04845 [Altibacter sp.]|uniref:hypothetical protein n=2 Tax=Altibacter TaxID=1535231 RepID=UPI000C8E7ABF|nr:hypothetical protein [Altibacter sp.]MAP54210.1 hypothetical protein [Altibacter sp.]
MKKFQLLNWLLVAFLAFQFTACDNEPLEGDFVDDTVAEAEEGQLICSVNNQDFASETSSGILSGNILVITSTNATTGEVITLSVADPAEGTFSLTAGQGTPTFGMYAQSSTETNPYVSFAALGGTGELTITNLDMDALTVSGTFNFIGGRFALDADGNPILDGSGNPVIENVTLSDGAFNTVVFTIEDDGNGNAEDEFYAEVEGSVFEDISLTVSETTVGGFDMLNLVAIDTTGAMIRIDIPKDLGVGTFDFFTGISDGTKLIAVYNAGTGGENLTSSNGSITFTEFGNITGKLKATFSFTATDPLGTDPTVVNITEGSFSVDYVDNSSPITNELTAEVDGVAFAASLIDIVETTVNDVPVIFISAEDETNTQFIRLNFPSSIEVGMYPLMPAIVDGTENVGLFIPDTDTPRNFNSSSGTLEIISYDTVSGIIEGRFQFTAEDLTGQDPAIYEITTGIFTVQLNP